MAAKLANTEEAELDELNALTAEVDYNKAKVSELRVDLVLSEAELKGSRSRLRRYRRKLKKEEAI